MNDTFALFFVTWAFISVTLFFVYVTLMKRCNAGMLYTSNPQLSSSASFLRLNVLSSLN